jgi:hypothetical protein
MSLDDRVRTAFDRAASAVEPATEVRLERTLRQRTRGRQESGLANLLAATAVVVAIVVGVRLLGIESTGPGGRTSTSSPGGPEAIAGSYQVTLPATDPAVVVDGLSFAGRWTLVMRDSGVLELEAPPAFEGSRAQGHTFSLDATMLRTDLYFNDYCSSLGTYRWILSGGNLRLDVVADDCAVRRTLLATRPWERSE